MKWFTCIGEDGLDRYADHLRVAIRSAHEVGKVEPHLIYDGDVALLQDTLHGLAFELHHRRSRLWEDILKHPDIPGFRHRIARGAFLRLEIPEIEPADPFVLYTDCDVMFTRRVSLDHIRPSHLAAAPEFDVDNFDYFNSGVLVINNAAFQADLESLSADIRTTLGDPKSVYDQGPLNRFYHNRYDRLPLVANWKPYWGVNDAAMIVHFHGPKLPALRFLIEGTGTAVIHDVWRELYEKDTSAFTHYFRLAQGHLS